MNKVNKQYWNCLQHTTNMGHHNGSVSFFVYVTFVPRCSSTCNFLHEFVLYVLYSIPRRFTDSRRIIKTVKIFVHTYYSDVCDVKHTFSFVICVDVCERENCKDMCPLLSSDCWLFLFWYFTRCLTSVISYDISET